MSGLQKKNTLLINLLLTLAAGLVFCFSVMNFGLGISDDSVNYLSAASSFPSLLKVDCTPYVEWPPLYPAILSIYKLTGLNILSFTTFLHGLVFCLTIVMFSAMTKPYFHSGYIYWILIICCLFSIPILQSFIFLWSEGIFILLILISIYCLNRYLNKPSTVNLVLLIFISIFICMQRKAGIIFTGAYAVILYKYKPEPKKALLKPLIYFAVSSAPFVLWSYRRYLISGSVTSGISIEPGRIWENLGQSADVLSSWLMPDEIPLVFRSIIFIIGIAFTVFLLRKYGLGKGLISFSLIIMVIYSSTLCLIFLYLNASEPIDDRLLSPVYLFFIFIVFITIDKSLLLIVQNGRLRKMILVSVILLPLYFIIRTGYHMKRWNADGTGGYNSKIWSENTLIKKLRDMKPKSIVTNNVYALSYYLNFKNGSASQIVNSERRITESHFIIAYFSGHFSHVSEGDNINTDISGGTVLYKGEEGIIIKK